MIGKWIYQIRWEEQFADKAKREEERNKKEKENQREVEKILKNLGIEMKVGGCGCCGSPWVSFKYKGKTILDAQDDCNLNTKNV